jgi:hypothetical protein
VVYNRGKRETDVDNGGSSGLSLQALLGGVPGTSRSRADALDVFSLPAFSALAVSVLSVPALARLLATTPLLLALLLLPLFVLARSTGELVSRVSVCCRGCSSRDVAIDDGAGGTGARVAGRGDARLLSAGESPDARTGSVCARGSITPPPPPTGR